MNINRELIRIAKEISRTSAFRNGEYVIAISGINGDQIFRVVGRDFEMGKPVTLLESVVDKKQTDDYDFNLRHINQNNWRNSERVLKPDDLEWARETWGRKTASLLIAEKEYAYDPKHENRPEGSGWTQTEAGWSRESPEKSPRPKGRYQDHKGRPVDEWSMPYYDIDEKGN